MVENLALKQQVTHLEQLALDLKHQVARIDESRRQLAGQLGEARSERDDLKYQTKVLEGALKRQQEALAHSRAQECWFCFSKSSGLRETFQLCRLVIL